MTTVFVGNMPFEITREDLRELFGQYGNILDVSITADKNTGKPSGFGFVKMDEESDANDAVKALHRSEVWGRRIIVDIARNRKPEGNAEEGNTGDAGEISPEDVAWSGDDNDFEEVEEEDVMPPPPPLPVRRTPRAPSPPKRPTARDVSADDEILPPPPVPVRRGRRAHSPPAPKRLRADTASSDELEKTKREVRVCDEECTRIDQDTQVLVTCLNRWLNARHEMTLVEGEVRKMLREFV